MVLIKVVSLASPADTLEPKPQSASRLHLNVKSKSLLRSFGRFEGCKYENGSGEQISNEFFPRHTKLEERLGAFGKEQPKKGAHFQRKGFNTSC